MAARSTFRNILRWAVWPVVVIAALNIENRATESGYGRVSPSELLGSDFVTVVYGLITSEFAFHLVLFIGGGSVFAWISHWLERADNAQGRWSRWILAENCQGIAECLEKNGLNRKISNLKKLVPRLNRGLANYGFDPIPDFDPNNEDRNKRSARYLRAICGPIKQGDLEHAHDMARAVLNLEIERAVVRPAPQGTGSGTRR